MFDVVVFVICSLEVGGGEDFLFLFGVGVDGLVVVVYVWFIWGGCWFRGLRFGCGRGVGFECWRYCGFGFFLVVYRYFVIYELRLMIRVVC